VITLPGDILYRERADNECMALFKRHNEPEAAQDTTDSLRPGSVFPSLDVFLSKRPERRESAQVEFGIMWREGARKRPRYRVAWLEETGELVAEALSEFEHLRTVELIGTVVNRETLELAVNGWERLPYPETTLEWVRTQVSMRTPGGGVVDTGEPIASPAPAKLESIRRTG
jgi:hypothetical protein